MSEARQPVLKEVYSEPAEVYDLIYSKKDYAGEAAKIATIILEKCKSGGKDVLEAACGTGRYMEYLSSDFNVEGFDLSAEQVEGAKNRLPNANIKVANMTDFDMGKQYDAVLCLFSSIGYLQTVKRLQLAITALSNHVKPGGLLIVEPWLKPGTFIPGHVSVDSESNEAMSVVRMGISSLESDLLSVLYMHHMVGTPAGVDHFVEVHKLAMYTDENFIQAYTNAGLSIEIDPEGLIGRRLCVGKKPL